MNEHGWREDEVTDGAVETAPVAEKLDEEQQVLLAINDLYGAVRSGGNWFYWIAGVSIINTLIALFNGEWAFLVGLAATQVLDWVIIDYGMQAAIIVLPMILLILGIFCMFGVFAGRGARWAFIVGMTLYTLDALIILAAQEWFGLALHAYVLYALYQGLKAAGIVHQIEKETRQEIEKETRRDLDKKSSEDLYRNPWK